MREDQPRAISRRSGSRSCTIRSTRGATGCLDQLLRELVDGERSGERAKRIVGSERGLDPVSLHRRRPIGGGESIAVVGVRVRTGGDRADPLVVERELGHHVLDAMDAEPGEIARCARDRLGGARGDVERRVGGRDHDRAALRPIDLHVREHLDLRCEQGAEPSEIDERRGDPLHEDARGLEARAHERKELACIEMGGARGPRMTRLRDQGIPAPVGQHERAARIAEAQRHARIGERIAARARCTARLALTTSGSSSITSMAATVLGTAASVMAGAEPHDHHVRRIGAEQHRQRREPLGGGGLERISLGPDERLGQAVVRETPAEALIDQRHGGGAADREIRELSLVGPPPSGDARSSRSGRGVGTSARQTAAATAAAASPRRAGAPSGSRAEPVRS